ncbi:MAG: hypothetical protein LBI02_06310, partial [Opitutaceae bacterium]|nr:hypothetical protein [Opitutaceae bacterium]
MMNTRTTPQPASSLLPAAAARARTRAFALLLAVAAFPCALPAQTLPPVNGTYEFYADTLYDGSGGLITNTVTADTIWRVADGVTVTVTSNTVTANTNGGIFGAGVVKTIRIEPIGTTGRVEFIGNVTKGQGAVFGMGMSPAKIQLVNVAFIGNQGTRDTLGSQGGAASGGGVIYSASGGQIDMTNVLFQGNSARHGGGILASCNVNITSGTFIGNRANSRNYSTDVSSTAATSLMGNTHSGYGGAIMLNHSGMKLMIARESTFTGNWARRGGGAVNARSRHSIEFWDTVDISDNFAGQGGALGSAINVTEEGEGIFFKYTGTTGVTDYVYSGNVAKGSDMDAVEITESEITGLPSFAPLARGGGFYFASNRNEANAKPRLYFDIATGVTVQIGKASNPSSYDSIATSDVTGTLSRFDLTGTGAGRLILHADNSYFQGTVNVGTGALLLGNQNA